MKTLASIALGAGIVAAAIVGTTQPASARYDDYRYGYGSSDNYREYCRDPWYRHRYAYYCNQYYDDDDDYGYDDDRYYDDGYRDGSYGYYPGFFLGFGFDGHHRRHHRWGHHNWGHHNDWGHHHNWGHHHR